MQAASDLQAATCRTAHGRGAVKQPRLCLQCGFPTRQEVARSEVVEWDWGGKRCKRATLNAVAPPVSCAATQCVRAGFMSQAAILPAAAGVKQAATAQGVIKQRTPPAGVTRSAVGQTWSHATLELAHRQTAVSEPRGNQTSSGCRSP